MGMFDSFYIRRYNSDYEVQTKKLDNILSNFFYFSYIKDLDTKFATSITKFKKNNAISYIYEDFYDIVFIDGKKNTKFYVNFIFYNNIFIDAVTSKNPKELALITNIVLDFYNDLDVLNIINKEVIKYNEEFSHILVNKITKLNTLVQNLVSIPSLINFKMKEKEPGSTVIDIMDELSHVFNSYHNLPIEKLEKVIPLNDIVNFTNEEFQLEKASILKMSSIKLEILKNPIILKRIKNKPIFSLFSNLFQTTLSKSIKKIPEFFYINNYEINSLKYIKENFFDSENILFLNSNKKVFENNCEVSISDKFEIYLNYAGFNTYNLNSKNSIFNIKHFENTDIIIDEKLFTNILFLLKLQDFEKISAVIEMFIGNGFFLKKFLNYSLHSLNSKENPEYVADVINFLVSTLLNPSVDTLNISLPNIGKLKNLSSIDVNLLNDLNSCFEKINLNKHILSPTTKILTQVKKI